MLFKKRQRFGWLQRSRGMWARNSLRGGRKPSTLLSEDVSFHSKGNEGGIIQTLPTTNARQCATPSLLPHVFMLPMWGKDFMIELDGNDLYFYYVNLAHRT